MKGARLSTVHLPTVSLPTVRLTTVGWPSGNKGGGVTPPEPEDNAWLWERIDEEHAGTLEDPIPYTPPMEIFKDKYYVQDGVTYLCTRDSGQALSYNLPELVGLYVELVE